MRSTRPVVCALALSLGLVLSPLTVQAALPLAIDGQAMPSLAPIVSQASPG